MDQLLLYQQCEYSLFNVAQTNHKSEKLYTKASPKQPKKDSQPIHMERKHV